MKESERQSKEKHKGLKYTKVNYHIKQQNRIKMSQ